MRRIELAADARAVDEGAVVALQAEMMGAHRRHRAGGADHLHLAAGDGAADLVPGAERAEIGADALDHVVVAGSRHRLGARQALDAGFGERDDAPRHRGHAEQLGRHAALPVVAARHADPAHFGRAAADIDQQAERDFGVEQVLAAGERQAGLLARRDDLEAEAGARLDHGQEILAVAGAAAGLGGDVAGAGHAVALDLGRADAERRQGALDRVAAQLPAQRHSLPQPDRPGIGVDDLVAVDRRPCHQEPAIVGAEIDGGESVRETTAVPASLVPCARREVPGHFDLFPSRDGNRGMPPRRARLPSRPGVAKSTRRPHLGDSLTVEQPALTRLV